MIISKMQGKTIDNFDNIIVFEMQTKVDVSVFCHNTQEKRYIIISKWRFMFY